MHNGGGGVAGILPPSGDSGLQPRFVRPESRGQRLEKRDAWAGGEFGVASENFARQRHPGGFAAAAEQVFAKLDQAFGTGRIGAAPVACAIEQRAAALGYRLQHFAEK
ncbi:MAG: hypothetical protein ACREE3_09790 [Stellaceae bacterium]